MSDGLFKTCAEQLGKAVSKATMRRRATEIPVAQLHALGLRGVEGMNPNARTPNMKPARNRKAPDGYDLYILGDYPSESDDNAGAPFSGPTGDFLKAHLNEDLSVVFDYVCRTRPAGAKGPERHHVECFRPSVVASIEKYRPKVLIACGATVFGWVTGLNVNPLALRGRRFPVRIGTHTCWLVPILQPFVAHRYYQQVENGVRVKGSRDEAPAEEMLKAWKRDIEDAEALAVDGAEPVVYDLSKLDDGIERLIDSTDIIRALKSLTGARALSIDLETSTWRPYAEGAKILTAAISTGDRTVAFPVWHSRQDLHPGVVSAFKAGLGSVKHLIGHNLSFDLEWLYALLGVETFNDVQIHDTMAGAFVRDERTGGLSLDFLCWQHLGLPLKAQSKVNRSNLANEPVADVLLYNGRDAKATYLLHRTQWPLVKDEDLLGVYEMNTRRIPAFVLTQRAGVCADQQAAVELDKKYQARLAEIAAEVGARPEVKKHESRYGPLNLGSPKDVSQLFKGLDLLPKGSASVDAETLEGIDDPLARLVLDHRTAFKLRGTYVASFLPGAKDGHVFPDGKIHCVYKTMFAATGRSSSEEPNNQNWPKRGAGKEVRRIVRASPGNVLVAIDYKQLEAWVIANASLDQRFLKAMRTGYDVHLYWAQRLSKADPRILKRRDIKGDMKVLRSAIKNEWVFPLFFGSSWRSCANSVGLDEEVAEAEASVFWRHFAGVKQWQRKVTSFYGEAGYVETLTGRRRRGPLGYNQVINTPVQGTASDLVVNAMCSLSEGARTGTLPRWCQPVLNIHDDLTFDVPKEKALKAVDTIIPIMLDTTPYPWAVLPLACEVEVGEHWAAMKAAGAFKGKDPVSS